MPRTATSGRVAATTRTNNLVYNGDFEIAPSFVAATTGSAVWINGTAAGSAAQISQYGWANVSGGGAGTRSSQFDTTQFHSGTSSIKVSTLAAASNLQIANTLSSSAANLNRFAIKINPNTVYNYSFWMKTVANSGTCNDGANITFSQRNSAGTAVSEPGSTKVKITSDWTQYTGSFTSHASAAYLFLKVQVIGNSGAATLIMDAWFDDIVVWPAATARAATTRTNNLIYNGDFEVAPAFTAAHAVTDKWIDGTASGSDALRAYGWATSTLTLVAPATAQFDSSVKYSGSNSMKLSTGSATGALEIVSYKVNNVANHFRLDPSTQYTLSAYVKTDNAATNAGFLDCREYTAAGATQATNSTNKLSGTNDWTLLTKTFTTHANTRFGSIILRNDVVGNTSDIWFDEIKLVPTIP